MDQLIRDHGSALVTILWSALGLAGVGVASLLGFVWFMIRLWASSSKKTLDDQLGNMRDADKELERKMENLREKELSDFKDKTSHQFALINENQIKAVAANELAHSEIKNALGEFKVEVFSRLDALEKRMPNGEMKAIDRKVNLIAEALKIRLD